MPAHLRPITRRCDDCDARATVELFNARNASQGVFCRRCGNRRLEGLLRREHREHVAAQEGRS